MPEESAPHLKGFMFINCNKLLVLVSAAPETTIKDTLTLVKQIA